uniref:Uncharacterized protein n=1 Tax=Aegilops tauschii subsp. strangulata TaxID=200361 RepID=A0A452YHQ6_AEGTS
FLPPVDLQPPRPGPWAETATSTPQAAEGDARVGGVPRGGPSARQPRAGDAEQGRGRSSSPRARGGAHGVGRRSAGELLEYGREAPYGLCSGEEAPAASASAPRRRRCASSRPSMARFTELDADKIWKVLRFVLILRPYALKLLVFQECGIPVHDMKQGMS